MANLSVIQYRPELYEEWNTFVERSNEGTIFHRLDFLMYHGDRFRQQEHHLLWLDGHKVFGLMPMAVFEQGGVLNARSPYGGSYGGPVFAKPLNYAYSQQIVDSLIKYLSEIGAASCHLTLPLSCCYDVYSETFRLALLEHGFRCENRDISSVLCLDPGRSVLENPRAKEIARKARKAQRAGVSLFNRAEISDFWRVMDKTFQKHKAKPTHTFEEFQWLCNRLPLKVNASVAYIGNEPVAGIGLLAINNRVNCSFYLCQDPEFQATQALSGLIYDVLVSSQSTGFKWFDFGTSSVNMKGRENIFRFKESFGATGLFRDTYVWRKSRPSRAHIGEPSFPSSMTAST